MKNKRLFIFSAVFLISLSLVSAFHWPMDSEQLKFAFGSNRDGFLKGMEFAPGPVSVSSDAELVFRTNSTRLPGGYPLNGGILAIVHPSSIMSIFTGIHSELDDGISYFSNGQTAGTSSSENEGVRFYIFDNLEKRFVNPVIIMDPVEDKRAPVIRSASLLRDSQEFNLANTKEYGMGQWHLLLDVQDSSPQGSNWTIASVLVLLDGIETANIVFDAAWAREGDSWLFTNTRIEEKNFMLSDGRFRLGPLNLQRGRAVLSLVIEDWAGNKREASWVLNIK